VKTVSTRVNTPRRARKIPAWMTPTGADSGFFQSFWLAAIEIAPNSPILRVQIGGLGIKKPETP
jgi:hypothetical protein